MISEIVKNYFPDCIHENKIKIIFIKLNNYLQKHTFFCKAIKTFNTK